MLEGVQDAVEGYRALRELEISNEVWPSVAV